MTAEIAGHPLTVKKKLGEGAQGVVFLVEGQHGLQAVKWYNAQHATEGQRAAIRELVKCGPPRGKAGQRFIWPSDLVSSPGSRQFGYSMPLIDKVRFAGLGEIWARRRPAMGLDALAEASFQVANSYRALHLGGHCYRDISRGNLMFDPTAGDVLICDNDNVGVNRQSSCQVWGTPEYMAPELVRRDEKHPSTDTDLHSLAVLLFQLWMWHHPLHGQAQYAIRMWDRPAYTQIYGTSPVFVFDPVDTSNRLPNDAAYALCERQWLLCPQSVKNLFMRAFTTGLRSPTQRVTEGEWQAAFLQLKDGCLSCHACKAVNLWEPTATAISCWHCKSPVRMPPKLRFEHPSGRAYVLLSEGRTLLRRHVDPLGPDDLAGEVIGEVVRNPNNPSAWGIRNLTSSPWTAVQGDGKLLEIPQNRAVSLNAGVKVNIAGVDGTLVA